MNERDEIAAAMLHVDFPSTDWDRDLTDHGRDKWRRRADALKDLIAERERRAAATALQEAADDEEFSATCDHMPWVRLGGHCQCGYLRALAADGREGQW